MPLTTAERDTLVAAINAIPVSDVDVPALLVQLAAAEATIAQHVATIASQAATIDALTLESSALEAKLINARAAATDLIAGIDA